MRRRRSSLAAAIVLAAVASAPWPASAQEPLPGGIAVIVNSANTSPDPSLKELQAILHLEKQFWQTGKRVVLILPPAGSSSKDLLSKIYHRTDAQLRKDWARRLFAGEIPAVPTSLRTIEAIVAAVTRSAGTIGVVPAGTPIPENVRVLAVDGKRPGDSGYCLAENGS